MGASLPRRSGRSLCHLSRAKTELVLEQFIHFDKELSVIAARSPRGEVKAFPAAENIHVHNILHESIVPARIPVPVQKAAEELAIRIAESLGVIGLIAVELFLTKDGQLYVNELAPRPHNSGHYTMEACRTSQFEQHVRAICNLPLGSTELLTPVVMVNLLGEHMAPLHDQLDRQAFWKMKLWASARRFICTARKKRKRNAKWVTSIS